VKLRVPDMETSPLSETLPRRRRQPETPPETQTTLPPELEFGVSLDDLRSEGEAIPDPSKRRRIPRAISQSQRPDSMQEVGRSLWARKKGLREQVMAGFRGVIEPVHTPVLYRVGIVVASAFVVILPVLYLALIALAAYGVYWHATQNQVLLSMGAGRSKLLFLMIYAAPLIAGTVTVLFMLKPLFARSVVHSRQISLNRSAEPLLFEFVEKVCDTVHAPYPSRIDVAFDINASASYGSGITSLIRSDLVLTIGLPLVAGTSLQQFAGILAHEFGHFSQGAGMRVTWIVRSVNFWFAKVVYVRDQLDEWLVETSEEMDFRVGWIFWFARLAVFLSRGILWIFMTLSCAASGWLLRQMEFDADRHEARLAGSASFEGTCLRLHWLTYGLNDFLKSRMVRASAGTDTGNPIRDFIQHCSTLNEHDGKRIHRRIQKAKTGWLYTHPADRERIENAARENAPGVFSSKLPAEAVFSSFDRLCLSMILTSRH
jgi:Zn-dependent protease with chaperone function